MAIKLIESFQFDGSPSYAKMLKKGYSIALKTDQDIASDDLTGINDTDTVQFYPAGRYDTYTMLVTGPAEFFDQDCPSCVDAWARFGGCLKIPIPENALDTYGVAGFSVLYYNLPTALTGYQTASDNDGIIFCSIGDISTGNVNIVVGLRALDNKLYLKVVDTAVPLQVSTGITGTGSSNWRGYHNDDGDCVVSNFIPVDSTWYTVEVKYKFSATAGHVIVYVNGVKVVESATNIAFATTHRNGLFLTAIASMVTPNPPSAVESIPNPRNHFNDLYVLDSTGTKNSDYIGNYRIRRTYPDANFVNEGFASTTPYSAVQGDDDSSSYVAINSGEMQIFGINDLSDIGGRIRAVQHWYTTYFENNEDIRIIPLSEYSGPIYSGIPVSIPASGGGYLYHHNPIEASLITGGDWILDEINNGNHGFTIQS